MNDHRFPLVLPFPLFCGIAVASSLALLNLQPCTVWAWDWFEYDLAATGEFAHGLPFVFMHRDAEILDADMGGMYHGVWPFESNPGPIRRFQLGTLAIDVAVGLLLSLGTVVTLNSSRFRSTAIRIRLIDVFIATTAVCALLAIDRLEPYPISRAVIHVTAKGVVLLASIWIVGCIVTSLFRRITQKAPPIAA